MAFSSSCLSLILSAISLHLTAFSHYSLLSQLVYYTFAFPFFYCVIEAIRGNSKDVFSLIFGVLWLKNRFSADAKGRSVSLSYRCWEDLLRFAKRHASHSKDIPVMAKQHREGLDVIEKVFSRCPDTIITGEIAEAKAFTREALATQFSRPVSCDSGVSLHWIYSSAVTNFRSVIFYLHGGAHVAGSIRSHGGFLTELSQHLKRRILFVEYGRIPEYTLAQSREDVLVSYQWLLTTGVKAEDVTVMGDSAGGGLAVSLLQMICTTTNPNNNNSSSINKHDNPVVEERKEMEGISDNKSLLSISLPPPGAAVLISPWVDLSMSCRSIETNADTDCVLDVASLRDRATLAVGVSPFTNQLYSPTDARMTSSSSSSSSSSSLSLSSSSAAALSTEELDRLKKRLSPLFSFHNVAVERFPPIFLLLGGGEILYDEGIHLVEQMQKASSRVSVVLETVPHMFHDFIIIGNILPEAAKAMEKIATFLDSKTGTHVSISSATPL